MPIRPKACNSNALHPSLQSTLFIGQHWTTLDTCCTFCPVLHSGAEFVQCNRGVLCNVTVDPNIRHGVQVVGRLHPPTCCTLTLLLHCTYTCTCTCEYACAHGPSHAHAHLHTDLADSTLQPEPSPCYCTALMGWLANMQAHANVHVHKFLNLHAPAYAQCPRTCS